MVLVRSMTWHFTIIKFEIKSENRQNSRSAELNLNFNFTYSSSGFQFTNDGLVAASYKKLSTRVSIQYKCFLNY